MTKHGDQDLTQSANAKNERRRNLRFPVIAMVEVIEIKSQAKILGRTNDLGLGGCYVDTLSPFPVGASVKLVIERDAKSFAAEGKIIFSQHGMGMGIAFTSATRGDVRLFQQWILDLSGKATMQPAAPEQEDPVGTATASGRELHDVLNELIQVLMRKNLLSIAEGKALLKDLSR
ncbi:MAG: PilZ domain-containing protein [Acidobacteriia bacterium]|nr:PilZ domain-containing protein [Terriglobia bacterium]